MGFNYQFGNKLYTSIEDLGRDVTSSWELTKTRIHDEQMIRAISEMDPVLGNKVEVCRQIASEDRAVFVLQYLLNNSLGFSYKGLVFEDLSKVGLAIINQAPYINERLEEACRLGLISDFMKLKDLDVNYPNHYSALVQLEKRYQNCPLETYFVIGYLLSEDKGFRYDGNSFTDHGALFNYLSAYDKVREFSKTRWNLVYLSAWLETQSLGAENKKWKELIAILEAWK